MSTTHGAYKALRLAKQGQLPDRRTRLGAAISAIEKRIIEHFGGELNNLQQIQLFNLLPLMCFLIEHPMTIGNANKIADDWKWCWSRVEQGLKTMVVLADNKPAKAPDLDDYLKRVHCAK